MKQRTLIIMGAGGRDFHNFNVCFRDDPNVRVAAFTAAQIPNIDNRRYPPELAGPHHPDGIPVRPESELEDLIRTQNADEVVFSYSDVSHEHVMHQASRVLALGSDFRLLSPKSTMLQTSKPVVAVCAVRTGCGKSQTSRRVCEILQAMGLKVVVVRHPMPYGDLAAQTVQRFADTRDLETHQCTIEEREEYEPHIDRGIVVFAGVDYGKILAAAETEADVIVWDGGNNDTPFYRPDLHIVVTDPLRPGHERSYHPGETNLKMADVVIINKIDSADKADVARLRAAVVSENPHAQIVEAASPVSVDEPESIRGKRVLAVEDGPTLTHGGMSFGAGIIAARRFGASEIVDPRPYTVGSIKDAYASYPDIGTLLPAMGYGRPQMRDLEATINAVPCDLVLIGTPVHLGRLLDLKHPYQRVTYRLEERGEPSLKQLMEERTELRNE